MLAMVLIFGCFVPSEYNLLEQKSEVTLDALGFEDNGVSFNDYCGILLNGSDVSQKVPSHLFGKLYHRPEACRLDPHSVDCLWDELGVSLVSSDLNFSEMEKAEPVFHYITKFDGSIEAKTLTALLDIQPELGQFFGVSATRIYSGHIRDNDNLQDAIDNFIDHSYDGLQLPPSEIAFVDSADLLLLDITFYEKERSTDSDIYIKINGEAAYSTTQYSRSILYPCMQSIQLP